MALEADSLSLRREALGLEPAALPTPRNSTTMVRRVKEFLAAEGLDTPEVIEWVEAEEVEYIDDLAHCFRSAAHVQEEAPALLDAWLAAAARRTEAWRRTTDYAKAVRQLREASAAIVEDHTRGVLKAQERSPGLLRGRPRPKAVAKAKTKDEASRKAAARAAVELSLSWAPQAGLARGLRLDDPLIQLVKEVHEARIAAFEPRGVWAAIRNWRAWKEYQAKFPRKETTVELIILLSAYLASKQANTGPRAAWNQFDWLKRHLKADVPLDEVAKPAAKGDDGVVREAQQAVAMPPEFLMAYGDILARMIKDGDWRRGPLAASLQVAYTLIRIAHLGRSQFTHENEVCYWLEAFRGKGKRAGARRAFKYAMVKRGLMGVNVGQVLYEIWDKHSRKAGYPLDYVAMDPETGVQMQSNHIQAVMRSVAASFMPDPKQSTMVQPYSNRRFGGTLCSITNTPPADIVAYGGWAGVPELAKVMTEASDVLMAWKRSMPHLYSDRKAEDEETQKLLHVEMLKGLIQVLQSRDQSSDRAASWDNVQRVSVEVTEDGDKVMNVVRQEAMATVGNMRKALKNVPVYGTKDASRRQFTVHEVARKRLALDVPIRLAKLLKKGEHQPPSKVAPGFGRSLKPKDVEPPQVKNEWVLTLRSKYLHRVEALGKEEFAVCKWRKGTARNVPLTSTRVIWRGSHSEAMALTVPCCPDKKCQF